jgi:hypothetical protein
MKTFTTFLMIAALCVAGQAQSQAQTENLGLASFANDKGPILIAVDAALAVRQLDSPYLMLGLFLAAQKSDQEITVHRDGITMVYQGREYKMPSVKELRTNYQAQIRDVDFYRHLGKEGIESSWMRFYKFPIETQLFPLSLVNSPTAADQGSMYNMTGFATTIYFKNPGFKKGDSFILKVRDMKHPELASEVEVVLK